MMARFELVVVAQLLAIAADCVMVQGGVGKIITESLFNKMLPNRNNDSCPAKGLYTYDAFIAAANTFPEFGTIGSAEQMKRELAAFFGQSSHETTGGLGSTTVDDKFEWGYCLKQRKILNMTSLDYFGRGPLLLTGRSNYQLAGKGLGVDLVANPGLVSTDPVISFRTAIWFWMTPQPPKPSCHDVMVGKWKPTAADMDAGRMAGYGLITLIINDWRDCRSEPNEYNVDRMGFYKRYSEILNIGNGDSLDCNMMNWFG